MVGMSDLNSFTSIIELWDTLEAMASDVGASHVAVRKWSARKRIPPEWWSSVLSTDKAREAGVSAELLTRLAAREPAEFRA
jgi:hypothetical protein